MKYKTTASLLLSVAGCIGAASYSNSALAIGDNVFSEARLALQAGNYAEAYCLIRPLAENGNAEAQFNIGWMYHNGYGLAINDVSASEWWTKAAEQGHNNADLALGMLYRRGGVGVKRNSALAITHLLHAAEAGEDEARAVLGQLIAKDPDLALKQIPDLYTARWRVIGNPLMVKVEKANVRKGPGKQHKVIATLRNGDELVELSRDGNWVMAISPDKASIVWIYETLVTEN